MTYDRPLVASWEKEAEVVRCAAGLSSMEAPQPGPSPALWRGAWKVWKVCSAHLLVDKRFQVMPAKHWPILAPRWQQLINLYASNSYEQELAFNDSLVIAEHRFEYRRPGGDFPAPANAESAAGTVEFLLHHARGMTERLEAPRILLVELQCGWGYRAAALGHLLQSHLTLVAMEENDKLVEAARENCSRNSAPASVHRGGVHDLQYLLQNGSVPHALIASSSRSAGLGEDLYSYISQIQVRELLYISAGRMSSQQDLPKLQKLGFEVRSLQVVDPMPGTDHVEIRAHLRRDDATDFVGPAVLTQGLGSACWSKCEWLCGSCENLVFRRHIRQCPRCGALRDLEAAARLQQKAELSTVIKAVQKDPDLREKWLKHCKAAELSKNPMLNRHSSNHAFLIENVDSSSLAPYQGVLRKHGIVLSSEVVVESEELPYANASRSSPRKLLIVSAKRGDWALQVAAEVSQSLRTRSSNSMFPQTAYPSQWIWASFDKKSQGPPKINQDAPQWQWVDIKNGDNILGTQCEVCVLVCIPHLQADALGALSGLVVGGGLLVLVMTEHAEVHHGPRRSVPKAVGEYCPSRKLFWRTPFDIRFGKILQDCPHTHLDHVSGIHKHVPSAPRSVDDCGSRKCHPDQGPDISDAASSPAEVASPLSSILCLCKNAEQAAAVEACWQHTAGF